jgi:hypothetical protein
MNNKSIITFALPADAAERLRTKYNADPEKVKKDLKEMGFEIDCLLQFLESNHNKPASEIVNQYEIERAQHKYYFDKVCDPTDWKNPINAEVDATDLYATLDAIQFFTATKATYTTTNNGLSYQVKSVGYRNGPAGP